MDILTVMRDHFWILVLMFCILGFLPSLMTGMALIKTEFRLWSYILFSFFVLALGLSFLAFSKGQFLFLYVAGVVLFNMVVSVVYKQAHKKGLIPQPDNQDDSDEDPTR